MRNTVSKLTKALLIQFSALTLLSLPLVLWANPSEDKHHSIDPIDINSIIESAKTSFEGPEQEFNNIQDRLAAWIKAFDFNHLAIEAHRWTLLQKQKNPKVAEHALNIAFLFPATHVVEMSAGPISAMLNQAIGGPEWLSGTMLITGTAISFPGFDPLFIVAVIAYQNKGFQKFVTNVRVGAFKLTHATWKLSGLASIHSLFFERFNPVEALKDASWFTVTPDGLSSVVLPKKAEDRRWDSILAEAKLFGRNISGFVKTAKKLLAQDESGKQLSALSYVNSVNADENIQLHLNPVAFPIKQRLRLRGSCEIGFND
jgi:hypothetical protein